MSPGFPEPLFAASDRRREAEHKGRQAFMAPMPLYFFHVRNDLDVEDDEGKELADLAAARECALEGARELVCESIKKGYLNLDHHIEVTDDQGETLLTLTFREAFTIVR